MAVSVGASERGSKASASAPAGARQQTTVLKIRGQQGRDSVLRAVAILEVLPGTRRVLLDEAGEAVVVRGTEKASDLRRALHKAQIPSSIISRVNSRRSYAGLDQTILAFLILVAQIVLAWRDFGLGWPLLPAVQAGAAMFVMFVLGAPLLREATAWLGRLRFSLELALFVGACSAWLAGAVSMLRLEAAGETYFALATLITGCGLLAHAANSASRAASSGKLQSLLQLLPETALVEQRGGSQQKRTMALRRGHVVHVEQGERFPADGTIVSGSGQVDESVITGTNRPYRCNAGDAVLAGTLNLGEPRRLRVTARPHESCVVLLSRLAADADPNRFMMRGKMDRYVLLGFLGVLALAAVVALVAWISGRELAASVETGLLIAAVGSPASLALAGPFAYAVAVIMLRGWGIWVRDPLALERAGAVTLLVISAEGVVTEGVRRVLKTTAVGGGDQWRVLGIAAAALRGSEYRWSDQIEHATVRYGVTERRLLSREYQGEDGVIATVDDGHRTLRATVGSQDFLAAHGIFLNPTFLETDLPGEPAAMPVFVAIDGHPAGTIWMTDPIRLNARSALRNLRAGGIETCLMGYHMPKGLEQIAGTIESDSFVPAEDAQQQVAELQEMRASGHTVAMVGHPVRDAAGLAVADLSIGFGALNSPAAARPGFLIRDASALLLAACFNAAWATQQRVLQSLGLAAIPMLLAVILAIFGHLDLWMALILTGIGGAAVLVNSLRLLRWQPMFLAGSR